MLEMLCARKYYAKLKQKFSDWEPNNDFDFSRQLFMTLLRAKIILSTCYSPDMYYLSIIILQMVVNQGWTWSWWLIWCEQNSSNMPNLYAIIWPPLLCTSCPSCPLLQRRYICYMFPTTNREIWNLSKNKSLNWLGPAFCFPLHTICLLTHCFAR